jgi:NAD(P)-dependent dehydrogenase (short-subunit alcohol dehydrogenase family)
MPTFNINDTTVAFVTGTNKKNGIGRAIVDALLAKGAKKVYATARDASQLDELVETSNGKVVAISLDVTDKDAVAKLGALYPDVNLVVNNAGYFGIASSTLDSEASESAMKEVEVELHRSSENSAELLDESQRQDQYSNCQHCFHRELCQFPDWGDVFGLESCRTFFNTSTAT